MDAAVSKPLNYCVWCQEYGEGELYPWPDQQWSVKALCWSCSQRPFIAWWRDWWIRVLIRGY